MILLGNVVCLIGKNDGFYRVILFKVCINYMKLFRNDICKKCVKELKLL